ncbi:MAG: hypothetical protein NTV74_04910 [Euryarchaeota archaeon]|nr:hypothetical protein [Euryarchaeota archaeon]
MKKGIIALIGMIVALVFIIVALIGPWYVVSTKSTLGTTEYKTDATMSLTSTTATSGGVTQTVSHADTRKAMEAAGVDTGIYDIFNIAFYLTIFALIVAILALVFMLGHVFNFGKPNMMNKLGMIFGIITFILALVAVVYFMVAVPGENSTKTADGKDIGFWYSTSESGLSASVGPGYAWYLMLVASIIALIASIAMLLKKSVPEVVAQPPQ